jgi:hypothetical protein
LARDQLRLNILIDERQQKQAALPSNRSTPSGSRRRPVASSRHLKDLIAKLEQNLDPATAKPRPSALDRKADATRPDLAALK